MAEVEARFPTADRHQTEIEAVTELERLPGVIAAAVWLDQRSELRDARIHVGHGAAPTIIANAAAHVLQSLGISCEARSIRTVVTSAADALEAGGNRSGRRFLLLRDFALNRAGAHVTCRVQLAREDAVADGEARELDTPAGRVRAAALATLRAAESAVDGLALGLEGAAIQSMYGRSYAVASVEASIGRRVATLAGLVPIDPSRAPEEAMCMATLRAIDRWVGL